MPGLIRREASGSPESRHDRLCAVTPLHVEGDRSIATGLLLRGGSFYALRVDGGGMWILHPGLSVRISHLAGRCMTIEGMRNGFYMIDVDRVELA